MEEGNGNFRYMVDYMSQVFNGMCKIHEHKRNSLGAAEDVAFVKSRLLQMLDVVPKQVVKRLPQAQDNYKNLDVVFNQAISCFIP